ncbi:MAG: peptidoglycan DD-metalloendopeptidase family protein [Bacteroidales bacterium]|nr:peptidoglycan DD-metalloendopeptidase family protein [Bacteroidales bacterium]MBD5247583.1 peptidoglycan DD-metalloendopeptidase family protein [Barnesiella sp.]MBD5257823.1 peptidoglycan DD-metalloendopeptidase family protein [Barnesiella sp.]
MHFNTIFKSLASIAAVLGIAVNADAQNYRLPGEHTEQHRDLIAGQVNINNQIKVDATQHFIDNLFENEDEPEMDIYTEGWDSKLVNPYSGMDVPDRQTIDVSKFCMPHPGYVTSPYGYRKRFRRMHKGVDLKLYIGDTIRAAFDGRVRLTNFERRGYGNYVILRHTNGLETVYGHLSKFLVEPDQYVKAGDPIALGGNTGRSTGPHLHFETRYMGYAINPAAIFDFANQTVHTDTYTFTKSTYQDARNYDPAANTEYAKVYNQNNPRPAASASSSSSKSSSSKSSGTTTYKVKKGDTLGAIAAKHHVTVRKLCQLNGINTKTKLKIGQRLKVK